MSLVINIIDDTQKMSGNKLAIIVDDAQNILNNNGLQVLEVIKQITEATGSKFIFISNIDFAQALPVHILRRSRLLDFESA